MGDPGGTPQSGRVIPNSGGPSVTERSVISGDEKLKYSIPTSQAAGPRSRGSPTGRSPRSSHRPPHIKRLRVAAKPLTASHHPTARIAARIMQPDQKPVINIYHLTQETKPKEARES